MSKILIASYGNVYTNGEVWGHEIDLGDTDSADNYWEIPETETSTIDEPKAAPIQTFDSTTLKVVENQQDGTWGIGFVIYAKTDEPKAAPIQCGILYSEYYCYEDELTLENEEVLKFVANEISENGGFAVAVRGLSEYDECYFRPFAIYEIGGEDVISYGDILPNDLFYQNILSSPMTLSLTRSTPDETTVFSLSEWAKANGYENAGITTYLVED